MSRKSSKTVTVATDATDSATARSINDFIAKSVSPRFGAPITALQVAMIRFILKSLRVSTPAQLAKRTRYKSQSAMLTDLKRVATGETRVSSIHEPMRKFIADLTEPLSQLHVSHSRVYKMWGRKNASILYALMTEKPAPKKRAPKPKPVAVATEPTPVPSDA